MSLYIQEFFCVILPLQSEENSIHAKKKCFSKYNTDNHCFTLFN